ncbi:MAG: sulfate ABC transporter permease subunit CysW, partial [Planctomyces sp.]
MHVSGVHGSGSVRSVRATADPLWVRVLLIGSALTVTVVLILVPLVYVFVQAFSAGVGEWWSQLTADPDTRHSIFLTFSVVPAAVLANTVFGIAAAWTLTRFQFRGRLLLLTLLDLPFAVSPVVAGLCILLIYGAQGWLGPLLKSAGIQVVFAWPGLVLATTFVTLPFVARELIPLMESLGADEELAAVSLGAGPWQLFWRVTLPNIRWGLLFGVIQCHARAIGEFGAVKVVSGGISGQTDTMPLRVEKLFQEYNNPGSFAVASVLTLSGKTTLLRIIAGLESADSGRVLFDDRDVTDLAARERGVGFVFQHYALFRHMTVAENIAFGLRVRKAPAFEVTSRVQELLHLVRLEGLGQRLPAELSGGQRQRVALARALAVRPQMLLLDEPFGALDARVRQELRGWLRRLHQEMHVTTVFVTHDQEEAFEMADQVVVMNQGR